MNKVKQTRIGYRKANAIYIQRSPEEKDTDHLYRPRGLIKSRAWAQGVEKQQQAGSTYITWVTCPREEKKRIALGFAWVKEKGRSASR